MLLPAIAALFVFLLVYNFHWKRRGLPPGPAPWPLVGNSAAFNRRPYASFDEWRRRFGPVFTFWLGETPTVVFADYATIHETLVKQADTFAPRFSLGAQSRLLRSGRFGILEVEGDLWREQRRFTLQTFRNFGMGRNLMEQKILAQTEELVAEMRDEQAANESIDLPAMIERCVGSIICRMLFGESFPKNAFLEYNRLLFRLGERFFDPVIVAACNVNGVKHLPFFSSQYSQWKATCEELRFFFEQQIHEHERRLAAGEVQEEQLDDYVFVFLHELRKEGKSSAFSKDHLRAMVLDLFIAGQDTTSNTLGFLVTYVLNHPEVGRRIERELAEKIGSGRLIQTADRSALPYLNAVICETQSLCNLLPLNLFRTNTKEVEVGGFRLPAGTCIVPQISAVLFDEKLFPNPHAFDPQRFLDASGHLKPVEELVPFGVGKRSCLGESLARMELFLIAANLFNRFHVEPENPKRPPSMRPVLSFTARSLPFRVRVRSRY